MPGSLFGRAGLAGVRLALAEPVAAFVAAAEAEGERRDHGETDDGAHDFSCSMRRDFRAFSRDVDTGSREENASAKWLLRCGGEGNPLPPRPAQ
ncbi:hypothetical protein Xaut_2609 [Xanthobacter versatilis]|uniref:Uncharacterized protein n=1 Tax=Xanthobacter autotrophicus (strain ATCC BAA-1158 / Py2) TaxID=78245 RepID=A7IIK8_XANP2|nr:hypothetical protein Xaut_2609 [Xanthobacter autotrophicus Py2]